MTTEIIQNIQICLYIEMKASLLSQMVNNLPAIQETWGRSLGWEHLLKESIATHSSVVAWRISWTEEPGRLQSMESQTVRHN